MNLSYDKVNLTFRYHQPREDDLDRFKYYIAGFDGSLLGEARISHSLPEDGSWIKVKACIQGNVIRDIYLDKDSPCIRDKVSLEISHETDQTHLINEIINGIHPSAGYKLHLSELAKFGITPKDYNTDKLEVANRIFIGSDLKEKLAKYNQFFEEAVNYQEKEILNNLLKEIVIPELQKDGLKLDELPLKLKDDIEIVSEAVSQNGFAIQYASDRLKSNPAIILRAVNQNGMVLKDLLGDFKNHPIILATAIKQNGMALEFVDPSEINKNIALTAVIQNKDAIKFVPEHLANDEDIFFAAYKKDALEAVSENGLSIKSLVVRLREDVDIALEAVKQNGMALEFIDPSIINNEIVFEAVKQNGMALQFAPDYFKGNRDLVLQALKGNGMALQFAVENLRADVGLCYHAVWQDAMALQFAADHLRADLGLVHEAVRKNGLAFHFAHEKLKDNKMLISVAIKKGLIKL